MPRTYIPTGRPRGRPPGSRGGKCGPDLVYAKKVSPDFEPRMGRGNVFKPLDLSLDSAGVAEREEMVGSIMLDDVHNVIGSATGCSWNRGRWPEGSHE